MVKNMAKKKKTIQQEVRNEIVKSKAGELWEEFKKQPSTTILRIVTGVAVSDKKELILSGTKLARAFVGYQFRNQLVTEIENLIDKSKIDKGFLEEQYCQGAFFELLEAIDNDMPDKDRVTILKHLFYAIIDKETKDKYTAYTLFKLAKKLESLDILILKATYKIYLSKDKPEKEKIDSKSTWREWIAAEIGFEQDMIASIFPSEEKLEELRLIEGKPGRDENMIRPGAHFRLTSLGTRLCQYITKYEGFVKK